MTGEKTKLRMLGCEDGILKEGTKDPFANLIPPLSDRSGLAPEKPEPPLTLDAHPKQIPAAVTDLQLFLLGCSGSFQPENV